MTIENPSFSNRSPKSCAIRIRELILYFYNVDLKTFLTKRGRGKRKPNKVDKARKVVSKFLRLYTGITLRVVGELTGFADTTGVIRAISSLNNAAKENQKLSLQLSEVDTMIRTLVIA